jgi:IS5 family transposase
VQGQLGLAILLETCFLQHWFNLSDPGVEEAFHDSRTFRRWASLDERTQLFRSVLQLQKGPTGFPMRARICPCMDNSQRRSSARA